MSQCDGTGDTDDLLKYEAHVIEYWNCDRARRGVELPLSMA
jgi:hypothetical protein